MKRGVIYKVALVMALILVLAGCTPAAAPSTAATTAAATTTVVATTAAAASTTAAATTTVAAATSAAAANTDAAATTAAAVTSADAAATMAAASDLPPETITMYLLGEPQPDAGMVYDLVNEELGKRINATVNVKYLGADSGQKYALVFASGEDFDCIYAADSSQYAEMATKNAFLEITEEMVQANMPEYYAKVPADFWPQLRVNGKVYMLPYLNKQVMGHYMVGIRGDLREKYGLEPLVDLADLEEYFLTVAETETDLHGTNMPIGELSNFLRAAFYKQGQDLFLLPTSAVYAVKLDDLQGNIVNVLDDPAYLEMLQTIKRLADAGVWTSGVLGTKTSGTENFLAGISAVQSGHNKSLYRLAGDVLAQHPEWNFEVYDLQKDKIHQSSSATRAGIGINARSKKAERTMMMLNIFVNDKALYDLTTYGVEGLHFKSVDDKHYDALPEGVARFRAEANCPWGWENTEFIRYPAGIPEELTSMEPTWIAEGMVSTSPIVSFNFDDTNVKNEVAAINNLYQVKGMALLSGFGGDPAVELPTFKAEMEAAGMYKVQEELQKQITAFMAAASQ